MIRISTADDPGGTEITVDGHLSGDYVQAIETCCVQAASKGKPVQLFLRDVSTVDEPARRLLRRLAVQGVELKAAGIYSSYLVSLINSGLRDNAGTHGNLR